jgi:hypothetical protein
MENANLKNLLLQVSDCYDDFVKGCLFLAKDYGVENSLINWLENNPEARTDEIIEKIDDLAGVEPTPLEIVD